MQQQQRIILQNRVIRLWNKKFIEILRRKTIEKEETKKRFSSTTEKMCVYYAILISFLN